MPSRYTRSYWDNSRERSAFSTGIIQMNAANFDAVTTQLATLGAALDALSAGTPTGTATQSNSVALPNAPPAEGTAQRETKWRVDYIDQTNGKRGSVEIPISDNSLLIGTDRVPSLGVAPWDAFVAAYEAVGRTVDGNTLVVVDIVRVGRNL